MTDEKSGAGTPVPQPEEAQAPMEMTHLGSGMES